MPALDGQLEPFRIRRATERPSASGSLDAGDHHRELVAAQAGHGVLRAHASRSALGDRDQQPVADVVAERVVDGLEVVDVDEEDGDRALSRA